MVADRLGARLIVSQYHPDAVRARRIGDRAERQRVPVFREVQYIQRQIARWSSQYATCAAIIVRSSSFMSSAKVGRGGINRKTNPIMAATVAVRAGPVEQCNE